MRTATLRTLGFCLSLELFLAVLLIATYPSINVRASDLTVCPAGPPDCQYTTIQAAVDAASDGDTVKVAVGTYTGVEMRPSPPGYNGPPTIKQVVFVDKSVTLRGGYVAPGFDEPPDPQANPTVLDAQAQGRVLFITGNISPTIEGLRITGGDAVDLGGCGQDWDAGGGVYAITATITLSHNQVLDNIALNGGFGGGLYLTGGTGLLSNNTFSANTAGWHGAGLAVDHATVALAGNTIFDNNPVEFGGGGVSLSYSSAELSDNIISGNSATGGGGVAATASDTEFSHNIITGNTAVDTGAGISTGYGGVVLDGDIITGNTAIGQWGGGGGGVYLFHTDATLTNVLIADNHAGLLAPGLYAKGSSPRLLHTTVARNTGGDGSGILVADDGGVYASVGLTNTIIVSHTVGILATAGNQAHLEATLWGNDTDWQGPGTIIVGDHNYWGNPLFTDPDIGDYHITSGSIAIDHGVPAGVTTDIDGDHRPAGPGYDLGADEWCSLPAPTLFPISNPEGSGDYLVDWSNVIDATSYTLEEDVESSFSSPAIRYLGPDTMFQVTNQQAGSWYYRVRASNPDGDSPWSNVEVTHVIPQAPLLAPISNPDGNGNYLVDWSDVAGAAGYRLQEDDNADFSSPADRYAGSGSQYQVLEQPSGIWYYRALAGNAGGDSPWSNTESVTADSVPPASTAASSTYDTSQPIPVDWSAADPPPYSSGLYETCLWYKLDSSGVWTIAPGCEAGASGTFAFDPPGGTEGTYYFQSIAVDNAGNVESGPTGDGDDSTVFDTTSPESAADSPERSDPGEIIPVTWQASDALSGLHETCLWYKLAESGSWVVAGACQLGSSGTFFFHPLEGCGTYYFQTIAADQAGNVEPGPADPGDTQTLVRASLYLPLTLRHYRGPLVKNGGFETGSLLPWSHGGELPQSISTFGPYGGTYAALLGEETPQQPHPSGSAWAVQEIVIPPECTAAPLRFWYRIFTNDIEYWSYFHAIVTDPTGVDHEILRDGYPGAVAPPEGTDLAWRDFTYDLAAYAGQTVEIRFETKNQHDGALGIWTYLDEVSVACGP